MSEVFLIIVSVLIVLAAIVLILVVLVQNSKGGGLASSFSSNNNIMGVSKTTDFVEKATWGLAGFIIIMSLATAKLGNNRSTEVKTRISNIATEQPAPQDAPNVGGSAAPAPATTPAPAAPAQGQPQQ